MKSILDVCIDVRSLSLAGLDDLIEILAVLAMSRFKNCKKVHFGSMFGHVDALF